MLTMILPTLNAADTLDATLAAINAAEFTPLEILVVDGGSSDDTRNRAGQAGALVIESPPGRGRQLAIGGNQAKGDWLLFLHADSKLSPTWEHSVQGFMADPKNSQTAAYFQLKFDDVSAGAKRVARLANWRANRFGLPYGDQGLLIHKDLYNELGGYRAELNLMEDVDLAQRIGSERLRPLPISITTSAAKYSRGGWWARPLRNLLCLSLFLSRAPNRWIERLYA